MKFTFRDINELRYNCSRLITDNGRSFKARNFENMLNENDVRHLYIPAYTPHCNASERAIKNVIVKLRIASFDYDTDEDENYQINHEHWVKHIQRIQDVLND